MPLFQVDDAGLLFISYPIDGTCRRPILHQLGMPGELIVQR